MPPGSPDPVARPIADVVASVVAWADSCAVPIVIIGGVAASLLGRPRFTQDVDALTLIDQVRWPQALAAAPNFGLRVRVPDPLDFARRTRMMLFVHEPTSLEVDVAVGGLPFDDEVFASAVSRNAHGVRIPLPRVEDLIVMKAIAHRTKDLEDITALVIANPDADLSRPRRIVGEFASSAAMPELSEGLERAIRDAGND